MHLFIFQVLLSKKKGRVYPYSYIKFYIPNEIHLGATWYNTEKRLMVQALHQSDQILLVSFFNSEKVGHSPGSKACNASSLRS